MGIGWVAIATPSISWDQFSCSLWKSCENIVLDFSLWVGSFVGLASVRLVRVCMCVRLPFRLLLCYEACVCTKYTSHILLCRIFCRLHAKTIHLLPTVDLFNHTPHHAHGERAEKERWKRELRERERASEMIVVIGMVVVVVV